MAADIVISFIGKIPIPGSAFFQCPLVFGVALESLPWFVLGSVTDTSALSGILTQIYGDNLRSSITQLESHTGNNRSPNRAGIQCPQEGIAVPQAPTFLQASPHLCSTASTECAHSKDRHTEACIGYILAQSHSHEAVKPERPSNLVT